jgi:HAD superfamily hydrolase (TIGR01450 family)
MLKGVKAFLLDLQGTLTTRDSSGKTTLIGGEKLLRHLREKGVRVMILTNATRRNEQVVQELRTLGLMVDNDEVLSASLATALYLKKIAGPSSVWVLGEKGLGEELELHGHRVVGDYERPRFVVVGLDRELTYDKLNKALEFLRSGAELIGCHASRRIPERDREVISVGPIVKALEYASGKTATIIGKPSQIMYRMAVERLSVQPFEAVMVSDEMENDLLPASNLGIKTALTLTGVTRREDISKAGWSPNMVVEHVDDLVKYLEKSL